MKRLLPFNSLSIPLLFFQHNECVESARPKHTFATCHLTMHTSPVGGGAETLNCLCTLWLLLFYSPPARSCILCVSSVNVSQSNNYIVFDLCQIPLIARHVPLIYVFDLFLMYCYLFVVLLCSTKTRVKWMQNEASNRPEE